MLKGYWHYWLNAVNEHSLHAPFVYRFYTQVVKSRQVPANLETIERIRQNFLHTSLAVAVDDFGTGTSSSRKVKDIAQRALSSPKKAALLYRCARHLQAKHILELGTSLGISTLYLSAASQSCMVHTVEGAAAVAALARTAFAEWPCKNISLTVGNIDTILPEVLTNLPTLDMLYLDANHRYEPALRYFQQCKAKMHEHSICVIDDIYWSSEMSRAWQAIQQDPDVRLSLDLYGLGIVFFEKLAHKQHYILLF